MPSSARPTINCSPLPFSRLPTQATRTYEVVGKFASNTMAATIISAVLVGGYTLFGLFSKPPGAAEIGADGSARTTLEAFAAALPALPSQTETRVQREGEVSTDGAIATSAVAPVTKEAAAGPIGRFEPVPGFASYNLAVQYYPRFAAAYFDRGIVLYSVGVSTVHSPTSPAVKRPRIEENQKRRAGAAQAVVHRAASRTCTCTRQANPDHRGLDALTAREETRQTIFASFGSGSNRTDNV